MSKLDKLILELCSHNINLNDFCLECEKAEGECFANGEWPFINNDEGEDE